MDFFSDKDTDRVPSSPSRTADKPTSTSSSNTAPKGTSAIGHTSHVPTPPSSSGTTANTQSDEEDNAPTNSFISTLDPTSNLTNSISDLTSHLQHDGGPSSSSSSSSNQLAQQEQQQVEQYKDDILLHTQLQLQLYLEDLEEAENATEIHVQIDQAAFTESLINSPNALDPLQHSIFNTHEFGEGSPGPLSPHTTHTFQQLMSATATAGAASPDGYHIGGGTGGLGEGGETALEGAGSQTDHANIEHGDMDLDWPEHDDDDDDEECLPPSETKYILYDDHVSPVSMAQALALLNDPLHEDMVVHVQSNNCNHHTNDSNRLQNRDEDPNASPIYRLSPALPPASASSSSSSSFSSSSTQLPASSDSRWNMNIKNGMPWRINHTGYAQAAEIDRIWGGEKDEEHAEIMRTGYSNTMGLPSPPTATAASKSSQAEFFGHECNDQKQRFHSDNNNDNTTMMHNQQGDGGLECDPLDPLEGRPRHRKGSDIYLNLAGTILSPINIHDIFFSQFYSRLVYLNLWDTNLGTWGAQAVGGLLADRMCSIQYLNLGCNRLEFEGIVQLAGLYKNQSLIELDLSENQLGAKAIHSLQQIMVRLKKDKICNIRRLNLSNNEINDVGCISIAKIINGTNIVQLDLSFNKISDWGASTILAAFESNELTLREINMEANPLTFAGGVDLCKILVLPQSRITHLDLRGAKVTDVGVPYLAEALKSHFCLVVSLNLYDCQLTDAGISKLAYKLSVNKSLRVLGLGRNCVGDMGIMALSQGLGLNNYLEELDLSENEIEFSRSSLEAMVAAMRNNTTLLDLRMSVEQDLHLMAGNEGTGLYVGHSYQQRYQNIPVVAVETQYYPQEISLNWNEPSVFATQVGEVMAPTYAALSLPLQVPAQAPMTVPTSTTTPPPPSPPSEPVQPPVTAAVQEARLERERQQVARAQRVLKSYVRRNHKRTCNLRKLCFEILAVARVLVFAKDDPKCRRMESSKSTTIELTLDARYTSSAFVSSQDSKNLDSSRSTLMPLVSLQNGLPTPPLASDFKSPSMSATSPIDASSTITATDSCLMVPSEQSQQLQKQHQPRGSLAGLPWELKEMILRGLDPEGLLSDRQFQAVMNYSSTRWETIRQPWERWGEIREMILEKTSCYYFEGS
ncbi:NACHT, LRR and PYD domains-containing protein 3 [Linnemannia zychae]|nr:NACHT, LRR and PYD domains-containing protein 3 [Linnemannia zychae]